MIMLSTLQVASGQNRFLTIPSSYSNQPTIVDGVDDDWRDNNNHRYNEPSNIFETNGIAGINHLVGQILVRNNDTHLSFFIKLNTTYPIHNGHRFISILFDENGDGVSNVGDDDIGIGTGGRQYKTFLIDNYIDEEHKIRLDPPTDVKTFQAAIKYLSDTKLQAELVIPFKDTNDYYDFKMSVPHTITFMLGYFAGETNAVDGIHDTNMNRTNAYSSFVEGFAYKIAQKPADIIVSAVGVLAIFIVSFASCLGILLFILRKKANGQSSKKGNTLALILIPRDKRVSIAILSILVLSLILVYVNPVVIDNLRDSINAVSESMQNQNLVEISLYALILGIISALLSVVFLRRSKGLLSKIVSHQQILLKASVILFVFALIPIAVTPILFITTGIPAILKNPIIGTIQAHISIVDDFIESGISSIIMLPLFQAFSIWIPSAFLVYMVYELRASNPLSKRFKIILFSISLILFVAIAIWNVYGLFYAAPDKANYTSFLFGPTVSTIILSFLAVSGYVRTIKGSISKLGIGRIRRTLTFRSQKSEMQLKDKELANTSKNEKRNGWRRLSFNTVAIILLILSSIGLAKNLFLLTVPFANTEFPLGYSLVNDIFLKLMSAYAISANSGVDSLAAAKVVYNSFVVFFSLFWIYDIIMIFRGFGEDFLNSDNLVYRKLRKNVGPLTAMVFLSLMILFAVGQSSLDNKANEINIALPEWVRQQIGVQSTENQLLSNLTSQLAFLTGMATLVGLIYIIFRSRVFTKKWLRMVPKTGPQ